MKFKIFLLAIALLLLSNIASATKISCSFDVNQNASCGNTGITYSGAVVFEVITNSDVLCRYSTNPNTNYNSMNSFSDNFYTVHKKEFPSLSDGVYKYYVRCRNISNLNNESDGLNELNAVFKISNLIAANIVLEESPLTAGKYEVLLSTTKTPATTPKLSYSYDGIIYSPIVLYGSGNSWKGYLVISDSPEEKVGSFKFEATDLEGRTGSEIYGTKVFITDTRPPRQINVFDAIGEYGEINLEWFIDEEEEIDVINIYRSENPNVDLNDIYKTVDSDTEYYTDDDVENGKTYYYRIAPEDEAGNIASLSKEVRATALTSEVQKTSSGLSPEFFGKVDAAIVSAEIILEELISRESFFNSDNEFKESLKSLGIMDSFTSSKSELNSIINSLELLKSQDLTEQSLDSKISSFEVKSNMIRKNIPESYLLKERKEENQEVNEESLRIAILEKVKDIDSSLLDKSIKESLKLIKDKNIKIKSEISVFEITYLDGSIESKSIVTHSLEPQLESLSNSFILLKIPSGSIDSSMLKLKNIDYQKDSETLVSFPIETKEIIYTIDRAVEAEIISSIKLNPSIILEESPKLTGYFLSNFNSSTSNAGLLILVMLGLTAYLFYLKTSRVNPNVLEFIEKAKKVKLLYSQGNQGEANKMYEALKQDYLALTAQEKAKVFREVKSMTK